MTTSTSAHGSPCPRDPRTSHAVRISEPGDLVSAVPALLGFHPHRSLVAICLTGTSVGAVMRHDLRPREPALMRTVLGQFTAVAVREGADRVLVVMVDDRLPDRAESCDLAPYGRIVDAFDELLGEQGISIAATHLVGRIEAGAPWTNLTGSVRGALPDPTASRVAVAQVLGGRAIRASRDELEAVLIPDSLGEQQDVADHIDAARERIARGDGMARSATDPVSFDRRCVELVLARIAQTASGDELTPEECAELALVLENSRARDALLALSAGSDADAAEQLWIVLARALPEPERAEPLALLGFSAYLRGDGPMAGVALCAALAADPCHRLANLLDDALQRGVRPCVLRELADVGRGIAAELGVRLPPPAD
ncbi:DUF4192 domain-containing protein [Prescottella equi]|uniref:DUF4192 domain-containing protein n=1 Tax=Rhodococcus hoagii TaxID=43767 RepID=UPI000A10583C|nr:DUF4192 domain-containing protein [Prescottella equi]ORM04008.1 hypothetical protein A5N72_15220 [Prescottella equi]